MKYHAGACACAGYFRLFTVIHCSRLRTGNKGAGQWAGRLAGLAVGAVGGAVHGAVATITASL